MLTDAWTVKLPGRVRPIIEALAFEEQRDAASMVRVLLDRALADRAINRGMRPAPTLTNAPQAQRRA
jgi:hypothetical protein